jgi:NarL family two-component system response regulator LiaR
MEKIKVLLADDHVVVREGIRELIQDEDDMVVVGEAGNGEEAVEMVSQLTPDVVLMDIAMPKLNGIEATRQIKALHPSVSILILTAYDSEEFVFALIEAGAAGYLLKNVRGREVLNSIRAVHDGESVLHPAVTEKLLSRLQFEAGKKAKPEKVEVLSQRELEVLNLGMEGLSNKEVAKELSLGIRTVQTHWRNIFNKLGVSSRTEAVIYGLNKGWITLKQSRSQQENTEP